MLVSLVAIAIVIAYLGAGQVWHAIFDSVGLVFAAALLLFICIARYGPEMEQASAQQTGN